MAKKKVAKKKDKLVQAEPDSWLDEVVRKAPDLYEKAASLAPFDDVIWIYYWSKCNICWCNIFDWRWRSIMDF